MRVLLVNVDSIIPNLALMKISTYHKSKGDEVGFNVSDPELIYISTILSKNYSETHLVNFQYPHAMYIPGGPGYDSAVQLPKEIEGAKNGYQRYPQTYGN